MYKSRRDEQWDKANKMYVMLVNQCMMHSCQCTVLELNSHCRSKRLQYNRQAVVPAPAPHMLQSLSCSPPVKGLHSLSKLLAQLDLALHTAR